MLSPWQLFWLLAVQDSPPHTAAAWLTAALRKFKLRCWRCGKKSGVNATFRISTAHQSEALCSFRDVVSWTFWWNRELQIYDDFEEDWQGLSLKLTHCVIHSHLELQLRRKNTYTVWTRQYFKSRLLQAGKFFNWLIKSISTCIIPCKRQQTYDCDQETAQNYFLNPPCYCLCEVFFI